MESGPEQVALTIDELRGVVGWAAACASEVLPIFEEREPGDRLPREAIEAAIAFADGGARTAALRRVAMDAYRAARAAEAPAVAHAAHAASAAAGAAFLHPIAAATQVKHVLASAAHAAYAAALAGDRGAQHRVAHAVAAAPQVVGAVLRRYPPAPAGGGDVGELMRDLDRRLRS